MRLSFYFIFLILAISPHDSREDRKKIYKAPSEFLSLEKINQLKDSETEISELTNLLNSYYSQFTEDKRIQNDKEKGIRFKDRTDNISSEFKNFNGIFPIPSDVNSIRKYQNAYRLKNSETNLVRDSNILFTAHYRLANLYRDSKNINKSLESYLAAIRYRDFTITEEKLFNTPELLDSDEKNLQSHKAVKDSLEKSKLDLKQKKDEYYKTLSEYSKMKLSESEANAKVSTLKTEIDTLEANLKDSELNYADSLKNNFKIFLENKSILDSNFLLEYAKIVYLVESNNKYRDKVTNKYREYYNGVFVDTDNNKNRNFQAYNNLLQFAVRINPKNSEAILLIAEESKASGKTDLAIGFFQKYLALEKTNSPASVNNPFLL